MQLGQIPMLSKATIEKNLDLQGMWVTILLHISTFHSTKRFTYFV